MLTAKSTALSGRGSELSGRLREGLPPSVASAGDGGDLAVDPPADDVDHVRPLVSRQRSALGNAVPAFEAAAATGGGGVLRDEYGMAAVGRLLAVLVGLGRSQSAGDELVGVGAHRRRAPRHRGGTISSGQVKLGPEALPSQAVDQLVDLLWRRHGHQATKAALVDPE